MTQVQGNKKTQMDQSSQISESKLNFFYHTKGYWEVNHGMIGRQQSEDMNSWGFYASDVCHTCSGWKMISEQWSRNLYDPEA